MDEEENKKIKTWAYEKQKIQQNILQRKKETIKNHFLLCSPVLNLILDITEEASGYLKSHEKVPEKLWGH